MYIEPNTVVKFCSGVKLDPTYQHTIYFNSKQEQYNFFNSKVEHTIEDRYFHRYNLNSIIVSIPVGQLYNCNYMMFQNTSFSNKWFYAFILNVDYKTNNDSIVYYMIDYMQTWFFDYTIMPSFVLREHSQTDVAGDNIVPETVLADVQYINGVNEQKITCAGNLTLTSVEPVAHVGAFTGDFRGCAYLDASTGLLKPYREFSTPTIQSITDLMMDYVEWGQAEAIMGVYPKYSDVSVSLSRPTQIGTYIPRNKKLLTGQYCRYTFELAGNIMEVPLDVVPTPVVTSNPRGVSTSAYAEDGYRVFLSSYGSATCPTSMSMEIPITPFKWAYNTYANNVGLQADATAKMLEREQTSWASEILSTGANIASTTAKMASTSNALLTAVDPGAGVSRYASQASNLISESTKEYQLISGIDTHSEAIARHHANMKAPATGASVNANLLMQNQQLYLSGYVWTVLPQDAERIDKFFDMYGYAVNQMKIPNRNFRAHWNYVKTAGLEIDYSCPTQDAENIKRIYENGITFWRDGDEIGNYTLDNTIH